ncbi:MAG: hypothetical protein ACR2JW_12775 [Thermomicrobiales bacterium]
MPSLQDMPKLTGYITQADLAIHGKIWLQKDPNNKQSSVEMFTQPETASFTVLFDVAVARALAKMLGNIPLVTYTKRIAETYDDIPQIKREMDALIPPQSNCVELGEVRIVGAVRSQQFDVTYRPDGVRFVLDTKTLNGADSIRKNWQNMINDLSTEATNVHSRFPHAVSAFIVVIPAPAIRAPQRAAISESLDRLGRRVRVDDPVYMAEAVSFVLWDPATGMIDANVPPQGSPLRIEAFSARIASVHSIRYKGLPPHIEE